MRGSCVSASMGAWIRACFRAGERVCVRAHKCASRGASASIGAWMRARERASMCACILACVRLCVGACE